MSRTDYLVKKILKNHTLTTFGKRTVPGDVSKLEVPVLGNCSDGTKTEIQTIDNFVVRNYGFTRSCVRVSISVFTERKSNSSYTLVNLIVSLECLGTHT